MTPENAPLTTEARSSLGFFKRFRRDVKQLSPGYFGRHDTDTNPDLRLIREKLAPLDLAPRQKIVIDQLTSATRQHPTPSTVLVDALPQDVDHVSSGCKRLSSIMGNLKRTINLVGIDVASVRLEQSPDHWRKGQARVGYYLVYRPTESPPPQPKTRRPDSPTISFKSGPKTGIEPTTGSDDTYVATKGFDSKKEGGQIKIQATEKQTMDILNRLTLIILRQHDNESLDRLPQNIFEVCPELNKKGYSQALLIRDFVQNLIRLARNQKCQSAIETQIIITMSRLQTNGQNLRTVTQDVCQHFGIPYTPFDPPPLPVISDTGSETDTG